MSIHKLTDTISYFADPTTHDLLTSLFGEQEMDGWQERALCAQTDPDAWFPEKGGSTREAKRICSGCEVRAECLEYALANDERFGIWGGLSERERRRLRRIDVDDAELPAEGEKRCRTCQTIRPTAEFHRNQSAPDGVKASCKECCGKAQRYRPSRARHSVAA